MIDLLMLGGLALAAAGIFSLMFLKGRRKKGVYAIVAGMLALGVGAGMVDDDMAQDAGFAGAEDQRAARAANFKDDAEWRAEKARRATAEAEAAAAADAENRRKGFHCLSAWDGSHRDVKQAVKDQLRNPSSFEHVETRIAPVDDAGHHRVFMTYRAENGFGGMNRAVATALVQQEGCAATILAFE